jgi:hypothetical protein
MSDSISTATATYGDGAWRGQDYQSEFDAERKVLINLRVEESIRGYLKVAAAARGMTMTDLILKAVGEYIKANR